jgi:hypothetical protein
LGPAPRQIRDYFDLMADGSRSSLRAALAYCARREHLRRTLRIALVVGIVLTAINQLDVILRGDATVITFVKCGLNFVVPFIVSNLGLLSGRAARA